MLTSRSRDAFCGCEITLCVDLPRMLLRNAAVFSVEALKMRRTRPLRFGLDYYFWIRPGLMR